MNLTAFLVTNLFGNIIKCYEVPMTGNIPANSSRNIFTAELSGIHIFNITHKQTGVDGSDAVSVHVNNILKQYISTIGISTMYTISNTIVLKLNQGDIVSLKTSNSYIDFLAISMPVTVYAC